MKDRVSLLFKYDTAVCKSATKVQVLRRKRNFDIKTGSMCENSQYICINWVMADL